MKKGKEPNDPFKIDLISFSKNVDLFKMVIISNAPCQNQQRPLDFTLTLTKL